VAKKFDVIFVNMTSFWH